MWLSDEECDDGDDDGDMCDEDDCDNLRWK